MCLAIPGKVISIENETGFQRAGRVDFVGIIREVNLFCVPEANVGDYVLVHVGLALSKIGEAETQEVFAYLRELGDLDELEEAQA